MLLIILIIINKLNEERGRSPRNLTTYFLNLLEFLLNHHIAIVYYKTLEEAIPRGGGYCSPSPLW